ncbi:MAG TPA: hypothetical protein VK083_05455 [Nocardia sp.]|uniref:hypothetical protein n=1 Tax=Nocardia TaxID=1817 RepID=UPI00245748FC|nr:MULTISPECIES: hypothetical protein [Nocardia]HLS76216.1 hypothetical protein [Nocardia sp.]
MHEHEGFGSPPRPGPGKKAGLRSAAGKVLAGLVGVACVLFALALATESVNAAAYYLGYGDELRVEVTRGSVGDLPGKGNRAGEGRVVGDGRVVELYGVDEGEIVTARPVLVALTPGGVEAYRAGAPVYRRFFSLLGVVVIGGFGAALLYNAVVPWRGRAAPAGRRAR